MVTAATSIGPKIALIAPALDLGGGVSTMARFLFERIVEVGEFDVDCFSVATSASDDTSVRFLRPETWLSSPGVADRTWCGIPYCHVGCRWAELEPQRYRPRAILTDRLRKYDLIQVISGGPAFGWVAVESERPVCLFVATLAAQERQQRLANTAGIRGAWLQAMTQATTLVESRVLPRMAHVFAESEYTRQLILPHTPPERVSLGVPGVDVRRFAPVEYNPLGPIVAVGRWADPRKNVRLLFHAYATLRRLRPDAPRLQLVGQSQPSHADWDVAVALGIDRYIDRKTNVSDSELPLIYRHASLFVLSSNEEGLGIVILEAMASGVPVVATRCGGPETAVIHGETGFLTPVGDANALAEAMATMLAQPSMAKQMGESGRERAEAMFSYEAAGRVYLDKYRELLANGAR